MLRLDWSDTVPGTTSQVAQSLTFDVCTDEQYEDIAVVTEHPVEQGAPLNDHVRPGTGSVTFEGLISNDPLGQPVSETGGVRWTPQAGKVVVGGAEYAPTALRPDGPVDRAARFDQRLQDLIRGGTLVTITTAMRTLDNMALVSFKVHRDATTGNALPFTLEARRLRIVRSQTVSVTPVRRARDTQSRGNQPASEPLESDLVQLFHGVTR